MVSTLALVTSSRLMKNIIKYLSFLMLLCTANSYAKGVYQSNDDFLKEVFNSGVPNTQMLWVLGDIKKGATEILGDKPAQLRVRYWRDDQQSAWILEEIGKEKPITVGLLIKDNKVLKMKVLAFRESRGWEVKESFFLEQFYQAHLKPDLQLDRTVDGISGATLSVRALKKLARLALFYHLNVFKKKGFEKDNV